MDAKSYTMYLERKLIDQFREYFYEKIGYYPIIITQIQNLPMMSLPALEDHFRSFLPTKYNKKVKLQSKCRYREIVELRMIYCYLARQLGYSLISIGQSLGKRDHTTIIHNLNSFKNLIETCEKFKDKYNSIITHIKEKHESPIMDNADQVQYQPESAVLS